MRSCLDEPAGSRARARPARASFTVHDLPARDPAIGAALRAWRRAARALLARPDLDAETRLRLEDGVRIGVEIRRVLRGEEPGEGPASARRVRVAVACGRVQAIATVFACPRAVFVELLASAPWNLLGPSDAGDRRTVRGAGGALLAHARRLSRALGRGGRVALQAENPRSRVVYEHLGFVPMAPADRPLTLVPRAVTGWAPPLLRLARGRVAPKDARCPFMLLDPTRARAAVRVA
jgi:GNAT superfamily N-acetyltransferase